MSESLNPVSPDTIATMVHWIRHEKVMLDSDLAELYGVEARVLNQAVKRNIGRFPEDFMFQLTADEMDALRCQTGILKPSLTEKGSTLTSQVVISKDARADLPTNSSQTVMSSRKHRGRAYLPYAFTEQGVAMLSSVLRSERAAEVNIAIMRTFVQLRRLMDSNRDLAQKIGEMEEKYDGQFRIVFDAIRRLVAPSANPAHEMGFHTIPKPKPAKKSARRPRSES
jgi:ORF6N domain